MYSTCKWLLLLLLPLPAMAQYVTITGTVLDPNGCPYVNGTASAVLQPTNVQYYFNTNNPANNVRPVWQLDSQGRFSIQLYETDLLTSPNPAPAPQWQFRFNSAQVVSPVAVGTINFTMTPLSLLTSQDISTLIQAQSAPLPPGCGAVSGGPTFNCASATVGANVFSTGGATPNLGCDPLLIDNTGVLTGLQFNAISPWNGELKVTAVNTSPPNALPASSVSWLAPNVIPSSYRNVFPSAPCTSSQTWVVFSISTDATGTTNQNWNCGTSGTSQVIQVNGTPIITESPANFLNGTNITITNTSAGNIQISSTASGTTTLSNPVTPTVTPQGTTGSTQYCYVIVGNENAASSTTVHSAATAAGCTSTGNATLVSTGCPASCSAANLISGYADTLYGYRCLDVYRTTGGGSQGKIATCVDKMYIDTGGAGDASTAPNTNTTQAIVTMNPTSGGCNYPSGSPQGVDGLPCTPNALDEEWTYTSGCGDANDPFYQWVHQSVATCTLTGGMVSLQMTNQSTNQLSCLVHPLPSAPYRISVLPYPSTLITGSAAQPVELGLYESSSGKFITFDVLTSFGVTVSHWTNSTTFAANVASNGNTPWINGPTNYEFGRDSSNNLSFWHSQDGVTYAKDYTETATNYFTSGPDNFAICINPHNSTAGTLIVDYDYVRLKNLAPGSTF